MITVSILIVYLPIMFFAGIIKFLFVPLALAVAFAMGASYLVSLTLAPVSVATLETTHHPDRGEAERAPTGGLRALVGRWELFNLFGNS